MKKERNVSLLIEALEYPLPKVRWAATRALGNLWDVPDLVKLGHPNSQKVRAEAAKALGQSNDQRVVAALIAALFDPVASYTDQLNRSVYPVRMNAITALCEIGDPCAIEPLLEALRQKSWYGQTLAFQGKLCENILKMGEPMLLHGMTLLQSPDPVMRQQAIYVLECFSDPRTIEPLGHFLMREQDQRY
jgi:HEAT repeat protein